MCEDDTIFDKSLSMWRGWYDSCERFEPIPLDIYTASSIGQYDTVRNLIKRMDKKELSLPNNGVWTAVMYASYIGHDNVLDLLLDAGADVHSVNRLGQTALMLAAMCGNESIAYTLLQYGANIEARDNDGRTCLHHAVINGHQSITKFLLESHASVDVRDKITGYTPLLAAAARGHELIVQQLLLHNANPLAKANRATARQLAADNGHARVAALIDRYRTMRTQSTVINIPPTGNSSSSISQKVSPSIHDGPRRMAKMFPDPKPEDGGLQSFMDSHADTIRSANSSSTSGGLVGMLGINKQQIADNDNRVNTELEKGGSNLPTRNSGNNLPANYQIPTNLPINSTTALMSQMALQNLAIAGLTPSLDPASILHLQQQLTQLSLAQQSPNLIDAFLPSPANTNVGVHSLEAVLESIQCVKYLSIFEEQDVDLETFLTLNDADLKEIGIKWMGPRKKMLGVINRLVSNTNPSVEVKQTPTPASVQPRREEVEPSFANILEQEIQNLTIRLQEASTDNSSLKASLQKETKLRFAADKFLLDQRAAWKSVRSQAEQGRSTCQKLILGCQALRPQVQLGESGDLTTPPISLESWMMYSDQLQPQLSELASILDQVSTAARKILNSAPSQL